MDYRIQMLKSDRVDAARRLVIAGSPEQQYAGLVAKPWHT